MDEKSAIQLVSDFLTNHGYSPNRLNQKNMPEGRKSPDFEVYEGQELKFLCELKTVDLTPHPQTKMFHWTTTISKLREHSSKAYKQFSAHDKEHKLPWVLFFTATHFQLNWTSMVHSLRGAVGFNGQLIKDLTNQRFIQATEDEVKSIDVFVWGQVNAEKKKIYQLVNFVSGSSQLLDLSNSIVDKIIPYDSEDIMDMNSRKYKGQKI